MSGAAGSVCVVLKWTSMSRPHGLTAWDECRGARRQRGCYSRAALSRPPRPRFGPASRRWCSGEGRALLEWAASAGSAARAGGASRCAVRGRSLRISRGRRGVPAPAAGAAPNDSPKRPGPQLCAPTARRARLRPVTPRSARSVATILVHLPLVRRYVRDGADSGNAGPIPTLLRPGPGRSRSRRGGRGWSLAAVGSRGPGPHPRGERAQRCPRGGPLLGAPPRRSPRCRPRPSPPRR